MNEQARYSTWIRKSKITTFWVLTVLCLAFSGLGIINPWLTLLGLTAIPFAYIAMVISLSAYRFGPRGGDFQNKVHQLIVERATTAGKTIDIGCGSAHLIVKLAKARPANNYTGVDLWGDDWEYSKAQCEKNASIEGVPGIAFVNASASKLPFENSSFDQAVSCLTFHEVRDTADKTLAVKEALRVIKDGGHFVFFDLFNDPGYFAGLDSVLKAISEAGGKVASSKAFSEYTALPFPLDTPKVLKYAVLIDGRKP